MGNCCRRESGTVWASVDQWDYDSPMGKDFLSGDNGGARGGSTPLQEQVRIKVTKRELEAMMETARLQDQPVDRVFSRLIAGADDSHVLRQRSWAPALHSIAE